MTVAAKKAQQRVDDVYPIIVAGKPHHITRRKQRIAWQLGYIKGFEEARKMALHQYLESHNDKPSKHPQEKVSPMEGTARRAMAHAQGEG